MPDPGSGARPLVPGRPAIPPGTEQALATGSRHYRAFVGPAAKYDLVAAMQFNLLTALGLREHHFLLDIGCGSLRGGRLFIPYLLPRHYVGIEPEQWLLEEGIAHELGRDLVRIKQPTFSATADFALDTFDRQFDFLLAQSIFSHAAPHQIERCLAEARRVMHPESLFAATYFPGEANYRGANWVYPSCVRYTSAFMETAAEDARLKSHGLDWPHPNQQQWLLFYHPDRSSDLPVPPTQTRILTLERELGACLHHYGRLASHPFVRVGLRVRGLLRPPARSGPSFVGPRPEPFPEGDGARPKSRQSQVTSSISPGISASTSTLRETERGTEAHHPELRLREADSAIVAPAAPPTAPPDYRAFVGPAAKYDLVAAMQFNLLTALGLREHHFLLDIGCGSLRGGRLFIPYLLPRHYVGIEPEQWLLEEGIAHELGRDLVRIKQPTFSATADFAFGTFDRQFDFLLAQSIFSHAAPHQIERCLAEARRVMHPESLFAATYFPGEANYRGANWNPGRATYTPTFIRTAAEDAGLSCRELDWPHPNKQQWLLLSHPDRTVELPLPPTEARITALERELGACRHHYRKLASHPYVSLGLRARGLLRRLSRG